MYIFAVLSLPLFLVYLGYEFGLASFQLYLRGLIRGVFWFLPWIVGRILFSDVFNPQLSALDIYYTYTFSQVFLPFTLLIFPVLFRQWVYGRVFEVSEVIGRLGSFLYFVGLSETFIFPGPGELSGVFFLPFLRVAYLAISYFWLLCLQKHQLKAWVFSSVAYGAFLFVWSYVPVLEFLRLPGLGILLLFLAGGLILPVLKSEPLTELVEQRFAKPFEGLEMWFRRYSEFYRNLLLPEKGMSNPSTP